jgi:transcriptional regulator with XRE-family HTH domain
VDDLSSIARELRAARDTLGLTREQLAEKISYTASYVEKIETGKLPVTDGYLAAAIPVLIEGVDPASLLKRLRDDERRDVVPRWFRAWRDIEQQAAVLRIYHPAVVPGLLQTDDYARELLKDEERVAVRIERQEILNREGEPGVVVIIDESVLYRQIGDHAVMYRQLQHLATTRAVVQVLPSDANTYLGVDGAFVLATLDGRAIAYAETPLQGFVLDLPEVTSKARERWETLRGESLPQRQSRELILRVAEERWQSEG